MQTLFFDNSEGNYVVEFNSKVRPRVRTLLFLVVLFIGYNFPCNRSKLCKHKYYRKELRLNYPISLRAKATAQKFGTPLLMT